MNKFEFIIGILKLSKWFNFWFNIILGGFYEIHKLQMGEIVFDPKHFLWNILLHFKQISSSIKSKSF